MRFPLSVGLLWAGASVIPAIGEPTIPKERPPVRPAEAIGVHAKWAESEEMFRRIKIPPAPPLSPEDALKTFRMALGYRLELVAAEPMVQNPISFEFDPQGRIWVVEYQGYQRDIIGNGEGDPICRVVVLEDVNEDGKADKSTVFLDKLVMPRSISFVKGGILLQEPPYLYFCEDTDGDLKCDKRTEVGRMGVAGNPQHTANGLRYGIDNWLHNSDIGARYRWMDGKLIEQPTVHRGQFGGTFDESGRYFCSYESSPLHIDLIPAHYLVRNGNFAKLQARMGGPSGVNVNLGRNANEVYPIRVTPQITLGAKELREDGRLRTYTIACGPCYYDGNQFPEDARGNVFIPESGGNLVGRMKLTTGIHPEASRFYPPEQEFMASTDERFRPVNARVGPDGALYLADMYKGIIEHAIFIVPWISNQVRDRNLATGNDMGRIYRIVADGRPLDRSSPRLGEASVEDLVNHLSHPTGWWRLTAQRLLVERGDTTAVPLLASLATSGADPLGRLHALWTLDGLGKLDFVTRFSALDDSDERVRGAAIRLCEGGLAPLESKQLIDRLERVADGDSSDRVKLQAALTAGALRDPEALSLLARMSGEPDQPLFRIAVMTGLEGREWEFLKLLLTDREKKENAELIARAAQCLMIERNGARLADLLDLLQSGEHINGWQRSALLDGMSALAPKLKGEEISLPRDPSALIKLAQGSDPDIRQKAYPILDLFQWEGMSVQGRRSVALPRTLSPAETKQMEEGKNAYLLYCAACHQPNGQGTPNIFPPLAKSEWVNSPPGRSVRIVLHGIHGPVQVAGQTWNLAMPGLGESGQMDDVKLSSILSYVRNSWGNDGGFVTPDFVADIRGSTKSRNSPWTADELMTIDVPAADVSGAILEQSNGQIELPANRAQVSGGSLGYRRGMDILAPLAASEARAEWNIQVGDAATYEIVVEAASDGSVPDAGIILEVGEKQSRIKITDTGGFGEFKESSGGRMTLGKGAQRVVLRTEGPPGGEVAALKAVRLVRVR